MVLKMHKLDGHIFIYYQLKIIYLQSY